MNVSYKGMKPELAPKIQAKLDAKFAKLSKLLEQRGEREAHVVVSQEGHLQRAEITIRFYDHQLAGEGVNADLFTALSEALLKIEKQAVKQRGKWREKHRREALPPERELAETNPARRVFRVNDNGRRKPITLDEALLLMDKDRDYVVYRDADKQCVSVLVRRRDGHFDLIEA
jgi:putative sigma-54 modulation protein